MIPSKIIKKILFFCLFIYANICFAQNYACIRPDLLSIYVGEDSSLLCVKIDSIKDIEGGKEYFNRFTFDEFPEDYDCYLPNKFSWLGQRILVMDDGKTHFIGSDIGNFIIDTRAGLGDSWVFLKGPDTLYIEAKVSEIVKMDFIGITDSVKKITLSCHGFSHNYFNNKNFLLSKNYGLLNYISYNYYYNDYYNDYTIYGIEGVGGGSLVQMRDVFDFNIGDEFHYYVYYSCEAMLVMGCPKADTIERRIKKVIDKYVSADNDTITYKFKRITKYGTKVYNDTILETYVFSSKEYRDGLPKEFLTDVSYWDSPVYYYRDYYTWGIKTIDNRLYLFENYDTTECLYHSCCWEGATTVRYRKGLGSLDYSELWIITAYSEENMVYYKKGNSEWGNPWDEKVLLEINEINPELSSQFSIYPNPANDKLYIQTTNQVKEINIKIYDIYGKLILNIPFSIINDISELDISYLDRGIYFVNIDSKIFKIIKL